MSEEASLGAMIRAARKLHGVTQKQLADICDVSKTLVYDWERDKELPAPRHLPKLAQLLPSLSEGELAVARAEALAAKAQTKALADIDNALAYVTATRAQYGL